MNAAKHIISEALSFFIQFGLFLLGVQIGLNVKGYEHESALLIGAVMAALIFGYNDWKEKKKSEPEPEPTE